MRHRRLAFALPALFAALAACQPGDEGTADGPGAPADASEAPASAEAPAPAEAPATPAASADSGLCGPRAARTCALESGRQGVPLCSADGLSDQCVPASCQAGETFACTTSSGAEGARYCSGGQLGAANWSACAPFNVCQPGESTPCPGPVGGSAQCVFIDGTWGYPLGACSTPLVLSFDGAPVDFTRPAGFFDLVGAGASFETDWVSSATPWLAIDLDGDGAIADGSELFGSMSALPSGRRAPNGFAALAALDDDGDGLITAADAAWPRLLLWRDLDQDRRSSPRELRRAGDEGLVALELAYRTDRTRCVGSACEIERAGFRFREASGRAREGAIVDVHFGAR